MRNNTKNKNKRHFRKSCLQCFSSEKVFVEHKEACFKINGKQNVKLRSGSIKFKNYFKQLTVSFKIYADFESLFGVRSSNKNNNISYIEKYQKHIPCSFAYNVRVDKKFSKSVVLYRRKYVVNEFIGKIYLKSVIIAKK